MLALRQLKRVPKNHKIVIDIPDSIQQNQMMEIILLCKQPSENSKAGKLEQLINSQHDPMFLEDIKASCDDFIVIDNEAW